MVRAVSVAAAVNASARDDAATSVAHAAAKAAADVAEEAASIASAVERVVITDALDRHQEALECCYDAAVAAAQAVLTHPSDTEVLQAHPEVPQPLRTSRVR